MPRRKDDARRFADFSDITRCSLCATRPPDYHVDAHVPPCRYDEGAVRQHTSTLFDSPMRRHHTTILMPYPDT